MVVVGSLNFYFLCVSAYFLFFFPFLVKMENNKRVYNIQDTRHPKYLPTIGLQQKKGIQNKRKIPKNCVPPWPKYPCRSSFHGVYDGDRPPQKILAIINQSTIRGIRILSIWKSLHLSISWLRFYFTNLTIYRLPCHLKF